jgi:hypothetical protein
MREAGPGRLELKAAMAPRLGGWRPGLGAAGSARGPGGLLGEFDCGNRAADG